VYERFVDEIKNKRIGEVIMEMLGRSESTKDRER
jgi:hypothetical protein